MQNLEAMHFVNSSCYRRTDGSTDIIFVKQYSRHCYASAAKTVSIAVAMAYSDKVRWSLTSGEYSNLSLFWFADWNPWNIRRCHADMTHSLTKRQSFSSGCLAVDFTLFHNQLGFPIANYLNMCIPFHHSDFILWCRRSYVRWSWVNRFASFGS